MVDYIYNLLVGPLNDHWQSVSPTKKIVQKWLNLQERNVSEYDKY